MSSASVPASAPSMPQKTGRILRLARTGLIILLLLAVANGVFLYFLPSRAATDYAWSIRPSINAAFMGAGYLAGMIGAGIALLWATRWRSVRSLIWPFVVLSSGMVVATYLHQDRFRWDYPPTWIWTIVYVLIPPVAVVIWFQQERAESTIDPAEHRLRPIRVAAGAMGLVTTALAVFTYFSPTSVVPHWPWTVTPLLLRAFASWYLLVAVLLLVVAVSVRRPYEMVVPLVTIGSWSILLLALPVIYGASVQGTAVFGLWAAHQALLLTLSVGALAYGTRFSRRELDQM